MRPSITDIYNELDSFAPFATAEEWDNVGILAGHPDRRCSKVLIALDFCEGVMSECISGRFDAVITHHPVMFRAINALREDDKITSVLCGLVRSDTALIASHTCLDRAGHGVARTLADILGLTDTVPISEGFGRAGIIDHTDPVSFAGRVARILNTTPKVFTRGEHSVSKCAVCPGSSGSFWKDALQAGADIYLTGEAGHHDIMDALENGLTVITAGHRETELPVLDVLRSYLQKQACVFDWDCEFALSAYKPYL